ncbi:amino acid ABC transporter ATP-binding protein [Leucobacter soli]|uniref:Glutamine transport ATP-binding protein GlnQ n=1 Tax=Leucobacter soli TaxID=2812850 RepID=A0A916NHW4_9MICO|nr:amino acid ABC transporter ATP-binding protein [Leucobacter soli]CAG7612417.1 Glutamine transport ATP-binding protein GlnQ [Leucobacter soli]
MSGADQRTEPVLRIEGVVKRFGEQSVLDGIDLEVAKHEVVVLIGASGSGKSTLLKTINLLEQVDDGRILLTRSTEGSTEGEPHTQDITDPRVDADAIRARIGVVFQHYNLFPHLRVLDNVTLAARKVFRTPRAEAERTGMALLERIGLGDKAREYPDRLSGGQQQRVAIARAIATDPELLLLDEITSALDPQLVGEVLDLVHELKTQGSTILMATHEMSFARRVADRVVYLKDGRIIESGPPAQVFDAPQREETRAFLARVRDPFA